MPTSPGSPSAPLPGRSPALAVHSPPPVLRPARRSPTPRTLLRRDSWPIFRACCGAEKSPPMGSLLRVPSYADCGSR